MEGPQQHFLISNDHEKSKYHLFSTLQKKEGQDIIAHDKDANNCKPVWLGHRLNVEPTYPSISQ